MQSCRDAMHCVSTDDNVHDFRRDEARPVSTMTNVDIYNFLRNYYVNH